MTPLRLPGRRPRWRRRLLVTAAALTALVLLVAAAATVAWHRLAAAVHHVAMPAATATTPAGGPVPLAGGTTVLVAVRLPSGTSHVVVLHDRGGRADVLALPGRLAAAAGRSRRAIDQVAPEAARRLVATVESLGVPVTHYVGLDLAHVAPASPLGQLVTGHRSAASLTSDPLAAGAVLSGLVHHLVLDRGTSLQGALGLLSLHSCRPEQLPVAHVGRVAVPTAAARAVVTRFLRTPPAPSCRAPVGDLIAR